MKINATLLIGLLAAIFFYTNSCLAQEYSGLWWDETKVGQGISIIQNQDSICGAWYLYNESGENMWLVFTGKLDNTGSLTTELYQYTGPALGSKWDTEKLKATSKGTLTIAFGSPESATMNFDISGYKGTLSLTPFANDAAVMFWDKNKPGQGISFFMEGLKAYVVWYLYDEKGKDMWLTSQVDLALQQTSGSLFKFTGPPLGSAWDPSLVSYLVAGEGSINLTDSKQVPFTYNVNGVSGSLNLESFVCGGTE